MFNVVVLFIVGIIACYFLAKVIIKFVPKKLHVFISLALYAIVALLAYKSYDAVMKPIKFNQEKEIRFTLVINNLKMIREAQTAHRSVTGKYAPKIDDLVKFIDTAQFAVTEARNETKTEKRAGGIEVEVEYRVVDTTGYTDVRANFVGRDYKNMMNVPGTDKQFTLALGAIPRTNGNMVSVYEVKVDKRLVLHGMDSDLISLEEDAFADNQVKGKWIRVGSLGEVSDSGNWPPTYDQVDIQKSK